MCPQEDASRFQTLIVDDEPEHAEIYQDLIQGPDMDVAVAYNGPDALRMLRSRRFQIILTDLIMPDMDGMELMRRVLLEHPAMIVIMITGSSDLRSAVRAMQEGAFSYFSKTGDINELRGEIRKAREILTLRNRVPWFPTQKTTITAAVYPVSLKQARSMAEAVHIRNVLRHVQGNKTHAAKILGITYRQLLNRIKELGI